MFRSPPVYSLCERVSWAGTQTAGPRALPLADTTAAGCFLREAEGIDVPVCMIPDIDYTCNAIRFKRFQAGVSQKKYLLTVNICSLEESSAGDGMWFWI